MSFHLLCRPLAPLTFAALLVAACSESTPPPAETKIESLAPASGELSGWTEGSTNGAGVEVGKSEGEVTGKINGDADPFIAHNFVAWARQNYEKDGYKLELRIWQMKDTGAATAIFADLATSVSLYSALTWSPITVGEQGRIADSGTTWWANARKGAFYIEVRNGQKTVADATSKADTEAFITAVVAKIPST